MSDLGRQMDQLMSNIQDALERNRNQADPHWLVCAETAHAFDLWDDDDQFPLWLSFIVAGQMREMGIEG